MVKYRVIVKVGNNPNGTARTLKYDHVNSLLSFTRFLDSNHPSWTWFNVYDREGTQLTSFTSKRKPLTARVQK